MRCFFHPVSCKHNLICKGCSLVNNPCKLANIYDIYIDPWVHNVATVDVDQWAKVYKQTW